MTDPPAVTAMRLIDGFRVSQALYVLVTLGIPDLVADGARASDELADELDCDHDALYRLLRFAAATGVLHEDDERRFSITPLGEPLRENVTGSVAPWARLVLAPYLWQTWEHLLDTVRTGENAFQATHGVDVWEYRKTHPAEGAAFDAAMTALTLRINTAIAAAHDWGRFATVVDVGGGQGALLAAILDAHPNVRGILFDAQHVVANATVQHDVEIVGGDFFREVPAGADAYLLKSIVHDWDDEEAVAILRTVRRAAGDTASVFVVELLVPPPNEGYDAKLIDLQMMMVTGGRERTRDAYARLFEAAGLRYVADTPLGGGRSLIEAQPIT